MYAQGGVTYTPFTNAERRSLSSCVCPVLNATNEVTELEELMEIKQLIQRQKIERMMKVHKEMRGVDRYREQPKEYKYHDPYDDWMFRQLADIDNRNNIPDTSPQLDFNETDYQDYLKEKWNRGL